MRFLRQIFNLLIVSLFLLFFSCNENDNHLFGNAEREIRFNVTLKPLVSSNYGITSTSTFQFDIDNDNKKDIGFSVSNHSLGRESYSVTWINVHNGFSLFTQQGIMFKYSEANSIDQYSSENVNVEIPRIYYLGDLFSDTVSYVSDSIIIAYQHQERYTSYSWGSTISQWVGIGEKYLVFEHKVKKIKGWIKIEVLNYDEMLIKSVYYKIGEEALVVGN